MRILVTGADGGIGKSVVEVLKKAGHEVISSTAVDTDLTVPEEVRALKERAGKVDWIVCAHGYINVPEDVEKTFAVNTFSIFYLLKEFTESNMIALSSSAGLKPNGKYAAYSASKAAVNAFVQAMARNRPEQKFFAIAPGPTNTEMRERIAGDASKMQSPAVIADLVKNLVGGSAEYKSGDVILAKDGAYSIATRI